MLDRKASQVQAIKGKLLKLPQLQFDATIRTIEKLVEDATPTVAKRDLESTKKKASLELYEKSATRSDQSDKTTSVNAVTH
jgi:hypothetical protein